MSAVFSLARHLVELSYKDEENEALSPMRLQKLLYFAEAWSLEIRNRSLFSEEIEAWKHGPVVKAVYTEFKRLGSAPIKIEDTANFPVLAPEDAHFVDAFWESYNRFSGSGLRGMSHAESPWIIAYKNAGADGRCKDPILREWIRAEYKGKSRPGPLAALEDELYENEKKAEEWLKSQPPMDRNRLKAVAAKNRPPQSWYDEDHEY